MTSFNELFSFENIRPGLTDMLSTERPFQQSNFPLLATLYNKRVDTNELNYLLTRAKASHGDLVQLQNTKNKILSENVYPQSTSFYNEKLLIGLRFTSLLCDLFGKNKVFSNHLEIAAGTALASYSMRCMGIIKNSDANDIVYRGDNCKNPDSLLDQIVTYFSRCHDYAKLEAASPELISGGLQPTSFRFTPIRQAIRIYSQQDKNYD